MDKKEFAEKQEKYFEDIKDFKNCLILTDWTKKESVIFIEKYFSIIRRDGKILDEYVNEYIENRNKDE